MQGEPSCGVRSWGILGFWSHNASRVTPQKLFLGLSVPRVGHAPPDAAPLGLKITNYSSFGRSAPPEAGNTGHSVGGTKVPDPRLWSTPAFSFPQQSATRSSVAGRFSLQDLQPIPLRSDLYLAKTQSLLLFRRGGSIRANGDCIVPEGRDCRLQTPTLGRIQIREIASARATRIQVQSHQTPMILDGPPQKNYKLTL